jgi:hypothetical protein
MNPSKDYDFKVSVLLPDEWWTRRRAAEAKNEALEGMAAALAEGGTLEALRALCAEITALNAEIAALLEERRKLTIESLVEDVRIRDKLGFADADAELRRRMTALLMADDGTLDMGQAYTAAKAEVAAHDHLPSASAWTNH